MEDWQNREEEQPTQKSRATRPLPQIATLTQKRERYSAFVWQSILILLLLATGFLSGWLGHDFFGNTFQSNQPSKAYSALFTQAWNIVDQHYVDRSAINYQQMSYQAIQAMLGTLHDTGHTRFLTPQELQSNQQSLSGSYSGIGIYVTQDQTTQQIIITSTLPNSPAEKAGLKSNDVLTSVNGKSVAGQDLSTVSPLIQGPANTTVTIGITRQPGNQQLTFHIVRQPIQVQNVISYSIPQDNIDDIQILQFADGTQDELHTAIQQAHQQHVKGIILDLREDGGGYLSITTDIVSDFVKSGNVLLEENSSGIRTPVPVTGNTIDTTTPMVVLVDHGTASAAEITAGALQENHRAIVIGTQTFGTGTVLQQFDLADGSAILLGVQEWLTPNGQFLRNKGITPSIVVPLATGAQPIFAEEASTTHPSATQILSSQDAQLIAALQQLTK